MKSLPQINKDVSEKTLLSFKPVQNNLSVSYLGTAETAISIRHGDTCVSYSLNDAEKQILIGWLSAHNV